jgi:hypothetical protein
MQTQEIAQHYQGNSEFAQQIDDVMEQLLRRSATDLGFRETLLTDSRTALAAFSGRDIGAFDSVNLNFVENHADVTIVLPDLLAADAELSDADLEAVVGGILWTVVISKAAIAATAAIIGYAITN